MGSFLISFVSLCMYLHFIFISSLFSFSAPSYVQLLCKLRRRFYLNGMHKPGDVILGGLFEVHYTSVFPELTFTSEPNQLSCVG